MNKQGLFLHLRVVLEEDGTGAAAHPRTSVLLEVGTVIAIKTANQALFVEEITVNNSTIMLISLLIAVQIVSSKKSSLKL